ncbi:hypothetical protein CBL_10962 [Carabus blaptoides fortunei]
MTQVAEPWTSGKGHIIVPQWSIQPAMVKYHQLLHSRCLDFPKYGEKQRNFSRFLLVFTHVWGGQGLTVLACTGHPLMLPQDQFLSGMNLSCLGDRGHSRPAQLLTVIASGFFQPMTNVPLCNWIDMQTPWSSGLRSLATYPPLSNHLGNNYTLTLFYVDAAAVGDSSTTRMKLKRARTHIQVNWIGVRIGDALSRQHTCFDNETSTDSYIGNNDCVANSVTTGVGLLRSTVDESPLYECSLAEVQSAGDGMLIAPRCETRRKKQRVLRKFSLKEAQF